MISDSLRRLRDGITACEEKAPMVSLTLPIRVSNALNGGRWVRGKSAKQRKGVKVAMRAAINRLEMRGSATERVSLPVVVLLRRVAPCALDGDGLEASMKGVRDGVADALGINDRDARVTWVRDQRKGGVREYAVEVEVYPATRTVAELDFDASEYERPARRVS